MQSAGLKEQRSGSRSKFPKETAPLLRTHAVYLKEEKVADVMQVDGLAQVSVHSTLHAGVDVALIRVCRQRTHEVPFLAFLLLPCSNGCRRLGSGSFVKRGGHKNAEIQGFGIHAFRIREARARGLRRVWLQGLSQP